MALALLAAGCLEVAEDRAHREDEIGHAHTEGLEVRVEDGLPRFGGTTGLEPR